MALHRELRRQGDWLFRRRSWLPVGLLAVGVLAFYYAFRQNPYVVTYSAAWPNLAWGAVGLLGLAIRIHAVGYAAPHTSGRNTAGGQIANYINQTGTYSLCRHPLYVGNFLMWLAAAGFTHNLWFILAFVLFYIIYYERIIYAEEAYLIEHYGAAYETWAARTPAVVPRLSGYVAPERAFDWRRVVKREKSGLANLATIAFGFHALGAWLGGFSVLDRGRWWLWILVAAWAWLLAVKLVQKNTDVLKETAVQGAV